MIHKSVKNALLLGMAAALLNYSFAIAQPANPPSSGALTPNFTGLNVSGDAVVGTLKSNNLDTADGKPIGVGKRLILGSDLIAPFGISTGNLEASNITSTSLLTSNIEPFPDETDINVLGNLKTDSIGEKTPGFGTRFSNGIIVSGQVSGQTFGGASAQFGSLETSVDATVGGTLKTNTIQEKTLYNGILLDDNTSINGQLKLDSITNRVDGATVNIYSSSAISLGRDVFVGRHLHTDSLKSEIPNSNIDVLDKLDIQDGIAINGTNLLTYLKNRISLVRGTKSQSKYTYATCPEGQIAISCGNDTESLSSRVVESFRATTNGDPSDRSCRTVWASASYNQGSVAICFDY